MAKPGEIAPIVSKAQYDYFRKQAMSVMPNKTKTGYRSTGLDDRGQPHRALRDEHGRVIKPGGGKADPPPSARDAFKALMKFHRSGKSRSDLPDKSDTKNAKRKSLEHAKMRRDKIIRPAIRPPGTREYYRQSIKNRIRENYHNANFIMKLDEALGL